MRFKHFGPDEDEKPYVEIVVAHIIVHQGDGTANP